MNSSFIFEQVGGYKCLVHSELLDGGIKHGFITSQLNLKDTDLSIPIDLPEIGKLSLARQTHSKIVLKSGDFGLEGDSFIVKTGEGAGVRTADCVPLILVNIKNKQVGAVVHAGWLGASTGIVENTLSELVDQGYKIEDFIALIGPAALSCCYEVQADVSSRFSSGVETRDGCTYLSVSKYVTEVLIGAGVDRKSIHNSEICTLCNNEFFSHRRGGEEAGRFLSFLSLD